ncbi:TlpA disulfide reductase family protein [Bartonella sp. CB169]|uniref:TlpA disulfide reductase family protein n=1 Tax=Bartonella sp. CB169 TaxID=3112257 RepID=UPI00300DEE47
MIYKTIMKKKVQFFITLSIALSLYVIINYYNKKESLFSSFVSEETAHETNTNKIQKEKIIAIRKAAKGFFTKIRFADTQYDMSKLSFQDIQGKNYTLAEFTGKPMLINLWGTWCLPCRTEMPELVKLKREMGGENFDVIAINTDTTSSSEKIQQFLQNVHADNSFYYRDKTTNIFNNLRKQGLALGLPVTLLIDKNAHLIASFNGEAPWANDDAKTLIKAFIKETQ